jgi:two-component system chemotaxis response regulator CheY
MAVDKKLRSRLKQPNLVDILLVDDLPQMREMVRAMLKANRFVNVANADSGKEGMRLLCSKPVDIVITDWNMPHMTGIELLKLIKTDPKLFQIPVLMISDEISSDKVLCALEEGVDGFLVKPFSEDKLIHNVRDLLHSITHSDSLQEFIFQMKHAMLSNEYTDAMEIGHEILKRRNHPRVALMMCECLYNVKDYEKAIDMIVDTDEGSRTSMQTNLLGKIYMSIGKHSQGILYLEQATKRNPLNNERKIDLARALLSIGNTKEGEKVIATIMNSNPTDLNLVAIAQIYLDREDIQTAGVYLEQTVDPIPETVGVFNNYAVALRKVNRFEDAVRIYRKCLKIAPDSDVLYYNLAVLQATMGNFKDSLRTLESALKINSDNEPARNLMERVKAQMPSG